jgi:hypothetical protein
MMSAVLEPLIDHFIENRRPHLCQGLEAEAVEDQDVGLSVREQAPLVRAIGAS